MYCGGGGVGIVVGWSGVCVCVWRGGGGCGVQCSGLESDGGWG